MYVCNNSVADNKGVSSFALAVVASQKNAK